MQTKADILIGDIEKLAKKATRGHWWIDSHGHAMVAFQNDNKIETVFITDPKMGTAKRHEGTGNLSHWQNDYDASYIATASPDNVLYIINELRGKRDAYDKIKEHLDNLGGYGAELKKRVEAELYANGCQSSLVHILAFVDALLKENIELKQELGEYE